MFRTLLPLFALIVAIAVFFTYIKPTFEHVKVLEDEAAEYANAVEKAEVLRTALAELIEERNNISRFDLERLEIMLPDRIDEVEFLIALDSLAKTHGLQLSNIGITSGGAENPEEVLGIESEVRERSARGEKVGDTLPFDIGFVVTGSYDQFRGFLSALEQSLNFVEVTGLTFSGSEGRETPMQFRVSLRAFTLAPIN